MSEVDISVIMPCYNAVKSVGRAIHSIQDQSFKSWELLVINDGSTDGSEDVVDSYAKRDSRIRVTHRAHSGVVQTSNYGHGLARSSVIARMDADDVSHPNRLERQWQALEEHPEWDVVSSLVKFAGDVKSAGGYAHHVDWANQCLTPEQIALNRFIDLPVPHPSLMFRESLVDQWGTYRDGDFPEDYELMLRWISHGVMIGKIAEPLLDWHDPPTRLSRSDRRYDMRAFHSCKAPYLAKAIADSGCGHRELWIAGAGRPARKCANSLEMAWKIASGFIDIDPRKIGRTLHGRPIVSMENLPPREQAVIVSYVGTRGARDIIRQQLIAAGRIEGIDFWLAA